MPTDTPTDERGIDRANDDLDRRVCEELDRDVELAAINHSFAEAI